MATHASPGVAISALRYWWVVAIAAVLGLGGATVLSSRQQTVVPALGRVVLKDWRLTNAAGAEVARVASQRVGDETIRASAADVVDAAAATLGVTAAELRRTTEVEPEPGTSAIRFSSTAGTAAESVRRVNGLIDAYLASADAAFGADASVVLEQLAAQSQSQDDSLGSLRARLATMAADDPQRSEVQRAITAASDDLNAMKRRTDTINSAADAFKGGAAIVDRAIGASGPAEPNTRRNAALGGAIGLLFGIASAWSLADSRQRRRSEAGDVARVEVGSSRASIAKDIVGSPEGSRAQAYRLALAHAVASARSAQSDAGIIAVAGSSRDAHVHEHATALCALAAADGHSVVLLDGRNRGATATLVDQAGADGHIEGITRVELSSAVGYDSMLVGGDGYDATRTLRSAAFEQRLKQLVGAYDLAIWSLPAIQHGVSLSSISHADSVLLTIPRQQEPPAEAAALIASTGTPFGGYVDYRRRSSSSAGRARS